MSKNLEKIHNLSLKREKQKKLLKRYWVLYVLLIPSFSYIVLYRYYPILIQALLSFKEYTLMGGIWDSKWVGFANFSELFFSPYFPRIFKNTVIISSLRLLIGFLPPVILAIFLYDLKSKTLQRVAQTIVYIPHFFSWVIVYSILFAFMSNSGFVNRLIVVLGGEERNFFLNSRYFYPLIVSTAIWKEIGWGTIIYLAALTNIDIQLFEAARIDGAGPLARIRYITIPSIFPVMIFLLMLSIGQIFMLAGAEQILLFYSPATYQVGDIIDTWVYREGLVQFKYSLGAAASFFQSLIGLFLIIMINRFSKKHTGIGVW